MRSGFFNRAVFLMESIINIIIKIDDLLLILNVLFNECLYSEAHQYYQLLKILFIS